MGGALVEVLVSQGGWVVLTAVVIMGFKWTRSDIGLIRKSFESLEDDLEDRASELKEMIRGKADKADLNRIERKLGEINGRVREHSRIISSTQARQQERDE